MSDSYTPCKLQGDERDKIVDTYGELKRADENRFVGLLADQGIELNRWREMLKHPRVIQMLLEVAEKQRPMVGFSAFVRDRWAHTHYMRGLLQRYGDSLFGPGNGAERAYAIAHALDALITKLVPVPSPLDAQISAEVNAMDTVPLMLIDTPNPVSGVAELKELFLDPGYRTDWDDGPYLMQYNSAASRRMSVPGARLVRFGVLPITPNFDTLEQVNAHLRRFGAKPAGTEAAFALAAYPRLASWLDLHPEGGIRRESRYKLWLSELEHSPDLPVDNYFTLEVQYDVYRRPWVRSPVVREFSTGYRKNEDYVPFIIPVQHWSPEDLLRLR